MKAMLLAGSIGACIALPAMAQSSISVYGIADAGVQISRLGVNTQTNLASGIADGSRLGFKGVEDLGGGYKAIFTLEQRIELDTGAQSNGYIGTSTGQALITGLPTAIATALLPSLQPTKVVNPSGAPFDRTAMAGLITPVGAILAGRQYTPAYEVMAGADTFESGTAAGWGTITGGTGGFITPGIAIRANQSLQYKIQAPNGIAASLMYGFNDTGSLNLSKHFWGANVKYQANNLNIGLGYNSEQDQNGNASLRSLVLGGSYVIGDFKLFAGYLSMKNDNSVLVPLLTSAVGSTYAGIVGNNAKLDADSLSLGMHYRIGSGRIMATIARTNDKLASNGDVTLYGIGYDHNLSKRTDLYAIFGHTSNQNTAQYALGGAGFTGGFTSQPGQNGNAIQLGMRHKF